LQESAAVTALTVGLVAVRPKRDEVRGHSIISRPTKNRRFKL
jgi:hypothetical protein